MSTWNPTDPMQKARDELAAKQAAIDAEQDRRTPLASSDRSVRRAAIERMLRTGHFTKTK